MLWASCHQTHFTDEQTDLLKRLNGRARMRIQTVHPPIRTTSNALCCPCIYINTHSGRNAINYIHQGHHFYLTGHINFLKIILPSLFLFFLLCFGFCWLPLPAAFLLRREAPVFKLYPEKFNFCNRRDKATGKTWEEGTASAKPHHWGSTRQKGRDRSHITWIQPSSLLSSQGHQGKLKPPWQSRLWRQARGPEEPPLSVSTFPSGQKGHLNQGSGHPAPHRAARRDATVHSLYWDSTARRGGTRRTRRLSEFATHSFWSFLVPFNPIFPSRPPQLYRFLTVLPLDH